LLFHSIASCCASVLLRFQTQTTNMATGPTANRPLTKTFCEICRQAFTPKDAMQIYQDKYFHPHCFCCSNCRNSLAGKPFYPKPNNQFQCENCNNALAPMYVINTFDLLKQRLVILVAVCVIRRSNQVLQQNDIKNVIIIVNAFGIDFSNNFPINIFLFFSCCKCNAVIPDGNYPYFYFLFLYLYVFRS
jgi:hypothetical protein